MNISGVIDIKRFFCIAICFIFTFFITLNTTAEVSAYAAITIESTSGAVLFQKNADVRRPMASTTKIMTALIAIEQKSLDSIFTVSKSAANIDGSQIGLLEGDKISLKDLLYMLMLKSANDSAEVIAENIAGSIDKFAMLMNERAKKMGLNDTNFMNPHGLPDDNHYTTAHELALITRQALMNPTFAELVGTHSANLTYHKMVLENSNRLLDIYKYANGVKTGFTKTAGRCLVSSATKDDVSLITVTLDDGNDWQDHINLFNSAFEKVDCYNLFDVNEYSVQRPVLNGLTNATFSNSDVIKGLCIDGEKQEYTYVENLPPVLYAPLTEGKIYGTLSIVSSGNVLFEIPLYLNESVSEKEIASAFLKKYFHTFMTLLKKALI